MAQAITLVRNEDYFKGVPNTDKIAPDDNAKALQLRSGELDLAHYTQAPTERFALAQILWGGICSP